VTLSAAEFHDIDHHTQELLPEWARVDNVDWNVQRGEGAVTWSTSAYTGAAPGGNEHIANALRWGTLYNFRFDADAPPADAMAALGLFRPGSPESVTIAVIGPGAAARCPADLNGDSIVGGVDLASLLASWGPCGAACPADLDGDGDADGVDLAALLAAWGAC
jgi:hypothetical protein